MRYAILSDIHGNAVAFEAVLADVARRQVDEIWCLGDIVGYGPDPGRCIELLRDCRHLAVAGNHDLGAVGRIAQTYFNPDGAVAIAWTATQLKPAEKVYLEGLPDSREVLGFTLVHGSPRQPHWEYITSLGSARQNFAYFKTPYCLVGHSHQPLVFREQEGETVFSPVLENIGRVLGKERLIINPGSVGQPRDHDPRASYMLFDGESSIIKLYRVSYDIQAEQARFLSSRLPFRLGARLERGV